MSETLAHSLKLACRTAFLVGLGGLLLMLGILLTASDPAQIPFTCSGGLRYAILMTVCIGLSLPLGIYLSGCLGLDVFGLNRLYRLPEGRPFDGLQPGEEERLALRWSQGGLGFSGGFAFKLLLTNRRLTLGSCLSSWNILDVSLEDVAAIEQPPGFLYRTAIRLHLREGAGRSWWDVRVVRPAERRRLWAELQCLGLPELPSRSSEPD